MEDLADLAGLLSKPAKIESLRRLLASFGDIIPEISAGATDPLFCAAESLSKYHLPFYRNNRVRQEYLTVHLSNHPSALKRQMYLYHRGGYNEQY